MMPEARFTSLVEADPETVWKWVQSPKLMQHVSRGFIRFKPLSPSVFPERWEAGDYLVSLRLFGWLPIGHQTIRIEYPGGKVLRDNGFGAMIRAWDHHLTVEPLQSGTRYTDHIRVDAGVLTPVIFLFAKLLFRHRQRRFRKLAAAGLEMLKTERKR